MATVTNNHPVGLHDKDATSTGGHLGNGTQRRHDDGHHQLAQLLSNNPELLPAFGGEFQPGMHRQNRKIANPAPLGLCAFALTTFVLSLINMRTRHVAEPNIVLALAFGYGGLIQILAGMWEMAVGNTFGATALSSYGGFWLSFAIILTPGGFGILTSYEATTGIGSFYDAFGFYLIGWFIFTFILLLCTMRSTVAFFSLFFFLDLAFLFLSIAYLHRKDNQPRTSCIKAGGWFGLFAAFLAWYNAFAGLADSTNSFFVLPVVHFPWSERAREQRTKRDEDAIVA